MAATGCDEVLGKVSASATFSAVRTVSAFQADLAAGLDGLRRTGTPLAAAPGGAGGPPEHVT